MCDEGARIRSVFSLRRWGGSHWQCVINMQLPVLWWAMHAQQKGKNEDLIAQTGGPCWRRGMYKDLITPRSADASVVVDSWGRMKNICSSFRRGKADWCATHDQ